MKPKYKLGMYRANARRRNIPFQLGPQETYALFKGTCFYCGNTPAENIQRRDVTEPMNGIDRRDSAQPYTAENCVSCCFLCNWMKGVIPLQTFLAQCRRISNHTVTTTTTTPIESPRSIIFVHPLKDKRCVRP